MLRPLSVNIAALYCPMESAPFYCFKFLFAQLNSDMQNCLPYVRNNADLDIAAATQSNGISYIEFKKNNLLLAQIMFNTNNGIFSFAEQTSGSWKQTDLNEIGIQKLAGNIQIYNGNILNTSISPGVYAVNSENQNLPIPTYGIIFVAKNNNWIFVFFVPTDLSGLYVIFHNSYGDSWSSWKHVNFSS